MTGVVLAFTLIAVFFGGMFVGLLLAERDVSPEQQEEP